MGARSDRRVVGVVGGEQLSVLLDEETRRKRLPCDIVAVDPASVVKRAAETDVVTFEAGPVDAAVLEKLDQGRHAVYPSTATLRTLQDPERQKEFLKSKGLPVADARPADARDVSVVGARGLSGEIRVYPAGENLYQDGILRTTIVPARIDPAAAKAAESVAVEAMRALEGVGVFCMETTVDPKGAVLIKEITPRVHNTGYYTIEACRTSQFEQHVRAITGMALGDPTLLYSAVVVKILGAPGLNGPVVLENVDAVRCIPGAFVHLYGRRETAPGRVLGHVTLVDVLDPGYREALIHRADHVRTMIIQKESRR